MIGQPQQEKKHLKNLDAPFHVTGKSVYVDDMPVLEGTLYARAFFSPIAHGIIQAIDTGQASRMPGVIRIFSQADIPGENQIGGIIPDEPLLATEEVHFQGQPLVLVVAETAAQAKAACKHIHVHIDPLPVIVDPREAFRQGKLLSGSRTFQLGDTKAAFDSCEYIFKGTAETGGQEHFYLETQGAYAIPVERNHLKIYSSTQGPTAVQRTVARVLGIPMNQIEVDVNRLGGGFGGKEDQASPWAAMVALAAFHLQQPVKYILERGEDLQMTGKRNPYSSDYTIGLDADLNIVAFESTYFQNGGAAADLSPAILERTLFHATNSYYVPNVKATAHSCKTNIPPNTAFRGFGGPQGMFVIEAAIHHAAREIGIEASTIQRKNLLQDGAEFSYGQIVEEAEAENCWDEAVSRFTLDEARTAVATFNANNRYFKKGIALMPVCFGISFTNTMMNHARALVHVYSDGSVGVSTGAVEMGQGVNTKMIQVAMREFGLPWERIKLETTNTTRVANTSPSAASATADLNGKALRNACQQIRERMDTVARELEGAAADSSVDIKAGIIWINQLKTALTWEDLVQASLARRVNLSAKGHYATPRIHFDKSIEKGHPFAYHVYGTAIFEAKVDCIRGTYEFDAVRIVHDFGTSLNRAVDLGQVEGGLAQGMGWVTTEDLLYKEDGTLISHSLANYKVPDLLGAPKEVDVHFLHTDGSELAIYKSKAVGEPPLMYGIGAYFAIANAMLAYNPNARIGYHAPITPEKVLMGLYAGKS